MGRILVIAGSLLVAGSGVYQLLSGKPMKKKGGEEVSMKNTRIFCAVSIFVGLVGLIYGIVMD